MHAGFRERMQGDSKEHFRRLSKQLCAVSTIARVGVALLPGLAVSEEVGKYQTELF